MISVVNSATKLLSVLTLIGDILIIGFIILLVFKFLFKKEINIYFIKKNALIFAFIIAIIATSGSLFYSEIAGYTPCKLCWFQRIFMYPLVLILGGAILKKFKDIFYYAVPMTLIGGFISLYHYIIQRIEYTGFCATDSVSCTSKYLFTFGYITIPMMALTAFILITILLYFWKSKIGLENKKGRNQTHSKVVKK